MSDFSDDFVWGVATSAYQIEGARDERGDSIWDRYCETPGNIEDGTSGAKACDHYHRFAEDIDLMAWLGVDAYRFSISWPRVMPTGRGATNEAGLDFYDRVVDRLLESGIQPFVTLHHWDLPGALQAEGGWPERATAHAFVDYADCVSRRLGDRVRRWITHNEPWCLGHLGHVEGVHAPGLRDPLLGLQAQHHLLLSHGWATDVVRRNVPHAELGMSHMLVHVEAASDSDWDAAEARKVDGTFNRWYLDPLYGRPYPADIIEDLCSDGIVGPTLPFVESGDMAAIATPTDFLGINYYSRVIARSSVDESINAPRRLSLPPEAELTDMGWEVYPTGLELGLLRVTQDYAPISLMITENGAAYDVPRGADGYCDTARIDYLRGHIESVARAIERGVPLAGYFVWSLLDNFEWSFGFTKRFGLVQVDFETGSRTPKLSAHWLRAFLMSGRLDSPGDLSEEDVR
jgi:beta-glucosidase